MSASFYEEVEIEDMQYDAESQNYTYPCPCGDKFVITLEDMYDGEDIGICPSCTLRIRVIYDEESLPPLMECSSEDQQEDIGVPMSENDDINNSVEPLRVFRTTDEDDVDIKPRS